MEDQRYSIAGKLRNIHGWLPERPDHRDRPLTVVGTPPPKAASAEQYCTGIEDQGELGSCTANASTSAFEAWLNRQGLWQGEQFSRLFQYYYTRILSGFPRAQDSGAYVRDTMRALRDFGVCVEKLWPYDPARLGEPPPYAAIKDARKHQLLAYLKCNSLDDIKRSVSEGFHVVIGFSVPDTISSVETNSKGIIKFPDPGEAIIGGHAVSVVAYDDDTQMLKFQNSWGKWWGSNGFGFLPYRFVNEGLAFDFWTIRGIE